ncbi:NFACT RNA binding domain-containing protein [Treponema sp.]|uniref:NFACT RNA binding domain-containing protein n=1 Tax=Treponema sp. TaxID=166 RepID=UPI003F0F4E59
MSLNCNEINLVLSELNLEGSFIQEIIQSGYDTVSLKIVGREEPFYIVLCTSPQSCRINRTFQKPPKNEKPLRFNEFLKSHVQGMRINSCRQLGLERIIKFDVSTWKDRLFVFFRLWSNAANIIVTDTDGKILDCLYRRPGKGEVSDGLFLPQEKIPTEEEKKISLEKFPIRTFSKEEFPGINENSSFNEKINIYYTEYTGQLSREALLQQAEKWYTSKRSKMENALQHLISKKAEFENAEKLRHTGDLILSFAADIKGSFLDCTDYNTGEKIHIRLNEKLNAQENAAVYYEQYKKAVSGIESLEHDIEISKKTLELLDKEYKHILAEKNTLKIEQLLRHDTKPRQQTQKKHPGLHYEIDGWTIIVGRNSSENDELLRHTVKGQDLWLHTRDYAGGYVFIKARKNKSIPLEILLYAGNLAVYHSKARKNRAADLYYTQVKFLRRAKNGPKGLVLPTQEKNLFVKIDDEKLKRLDEIEKSNIIL